MCGRPKQWAMSNLPPSSINITETETQSITNMPNQSTFNILNMFTQFLGFDPIFSTDQSILSCISPLSLPTTRHTWRKPPLSRPRRPGFIWGRDKLMEERWDYTWDMYDIFIYIYMCVHYMCGIYEMCGMYEIYV